MKKYILALDLGTTGNRAILFDRQQRIIKKAYQEFRQIFPKPGWVEHDPNEIWRTTFGVMKKVLSGVRLEEVAAVGVTNQRETAVVWDKKTGRPVFNAIVWQCRRTQKECEALKRAGWSKRIKQKTGLVIDSYFSATKIKWILDHVSGVRQKAKQGRLAFGTIDSWIIWKMTEGKCHVTDYSNASRTMLLNIKSLRWDKMLCRKFGIPFSMLPQLVDSSGVIGTLSCAGLRTEIPIAGIIGDQQGAMFAQGCFEPGVVKNTYGTGLFLQTNTRHKLIFEKNLLSTVAWKIGRQVDYALEGSVFIGGAVIQWLRDGLKVIHHAKETARLAQNLASNEGVYFVPALVGLGAPYWDSSARGTILGITRGTQVEHLARAALESIAYQTKDVVVEMEKGLGRSLKKLQVDGGAAANNFLMQFQADLLGSCVERPRIIETTALGAAGLAGLAVHFWPSKEAFLKNRSVDRVFKPRVNQTVSQRLYVQWKRAVIRSLGWHHE
ncbi:MAG: glycerol kinase [Candidatus Omnitrophica bacterium CG11_big_fil_rev_8_21_14_0_20_45_26]|uniref:Glycerol kinase n=1 Tax=Candidatus Abzuiibacterium crystallinum TaxID=1974748 RepID=A0A2H0LMH4_9BACT|nr:MAG: glycerol kinase [Candidatus Omnitrophica bacterium CG11_big_fil_rev_8_21_14_0_20_45_26]PIW63738.1 MAG: glycerol kinase [Candidatus Omnitrophica bacterium CG12_big_fil_rev_8_21_14_0_65_45_16]